MKAQEIHVPAQSGNRPERAVDNRRVVETLTSATPCMGASARITEVSSAEVPVRETMSSRTDMFTVIADIKSSSPPTSTPRDLEFQTPPQLRSLQDVDGRVGIPPTPTFAANNGENEEPFFGSSPTPGTRHCATSSNIPASLPVSGHECAVLNDPPSSPPEYRGSPRKDRKRSRFKASTLQREISYLAKSGPTRSMRMTDEANVRTKPVNDGTSGVVESFPMDIADDSLSADEQLPVPKRRRSLRSAYSRSHSAPSTPNVKGIGPSAIHLVKFDGVANKDDSRDHQTIKPAPTAEAISIPDQLEIVADSSGDDLELQIASQLEQDMALAGNVEEQTGEQEPARLSHSYPLTRKRKREILETPMTSENARPRSSRSAPAPDPSLEEVSEVRTTRSGRVRSSQASLNVNDPALTPSQSAIKKRKTQKAADAAATPEATTSEEQGGLAAEPDSLGRLETSESSPEKRRRSLRRGGQTGLPPAEDFQAKHELIRESRSRRKHTPDHSPELDETLTEVEETQENVTLDSNYGEPDAPAAVLDQAVEGTAIALTGYNQQKQVETAVEDHLDAADGGRELQPADGQQPKTHLPMRDVDPVVADEGSPDEAAPQTTAQAVPPDDTKAVSTEGEVTETAILDSLRNVLTHVKRSSLSRSALREVDDLLFEIRMETHEANRRYGV